MRQDLPINETLVQYRACEELIDRGWHSDRILKETGYSEDVLRAARRERSLRRARARAAKSHADRTCFKPLGDLLEALKAHHPRHEDVPEPSLGRPVRFGGIWRLGL